MLSHERPSFARRGFLSGLASVPVAAIVTAPALSASTAPVSDVEAMWRAYMAARGAQTAACRAWRAAHDQVPWWAKPGPSYMRYDGTVCGDYSSAPAIQRDTRPEMGISVLIRPTEASIEEDRRIRRGMYHDADLDARHDSALASLRERQAAAQAERDRLNEPALSQAADDATEATYAIEDEILALEPASPAVIAMQIMLRARGEANDNATISSGGEMGIAALGLRGLLPMLTGEIASTAADFIADAERRLDAMRVWLGALPAA